MPVSKVEYHPPHDFEVREIELLDSGVIVIQPTLGANHQYATLGHLVVYDTDGTRLTTKVQVHPKTGDVRLTRIIKRAKVKPARPAEGHAEPPDDDGGE
jgi:hypothetical protein